MFIKKEAIKKRAYTEGDRVHFLTNEGTQKSGIITLLRNDTIFLNGQPLHKDQVAYVLLDKRKNSFPVDGKTFLLVTGGVALTTFGLTLNDVKEPGPAFAIAAAIGYGPLLVRFLSGRVFYAMQRKKFRIGKKFRLQVLDFHIPVQKGF